MGMEREREREREREDMCMQVSCGFLYRRIARPGKREENEKKNLEIKGEHERK